MVGGGVMNARKSVGQRRGRHERGVVESSIHNAHESTCRLLPMLRSAAGIRAIRPAHLLRDER
jgi:hypothetical protein